MLRLLGEVRFLISILCFVVSAVIARAQTPVLEEVVFSRSGGIIADTVVLDVAQPAVSGGVVRYTLDNSEPGEASPEWAGPLQVELSTVVRARIFAPGALPGPVKSRHFIRAGASLVNYLNSGRPFSSNIPLVVVEPFGGDIENSREPLFTYAVTIRPDNTGAASLLGDSDYQGRGAMRIRGETSAGFPQRPFAWETHDETGADKAESLLGMPAESDWVLYNPYTDKTLMRNFLAYSLMRQLRGEGSAMRTVFCEVFINTDPQTPLEMDDYRGVYVLIERIKRDKNRVNIAALGPADSDPALVTGGYIFRKDKPSPDFTFSTGVTFTQLQLTEPELPNSEQAAYIQSHIDDFETALYSDSFADPVAGYAAYIDPLTFIDNQWFVEVTKQIDGYRLSTYFTKDRGRKIRALPIWDYNLSLGNADYLNGWMSRGWYYALDDGSGDYFWYPRLHQDPAYELAHWDRYWELRRGVFSKANVNGEIMRLRSVLLAGRREPLTNTTPQSVQSPAARHFRQWPILGTYVWPNAPGFDRRKTFQSEVSTMTRFVNSRIAWIDAQNVRGRAIFRPPVISLPGGIIRAGRSTLITRFNGTPPAGMQFASGRIYYTTDGRDPRGADGRPQGTRYTGALRILQTQTLKARLFDGVKWSPLATATYVVGAAAPTSANITVSELMYHALDPSPADIAQGFLNTSMFDWIEIANTSTTPVDVGTLRFTEGIAFDFAGIGAGQRILAPGAAAVVVANKAAFLLRNPSVPEAAILGEFTGSLANSGERVTLKTATETVVSDFTYDDFTPWPAADGTGASLEQTEPAAANPLDAPASWRASPTQGGTPGVLN
jgi:hypothetical protein